MSSKSGWSIEDGFIDVRKVCCFEIRKGNKTLILRDIGNQDYVSMKQIERWIIRDTRAKITSVGDYTNFLMKIDDYDRTQLFWGRDKLFGDDWESLRRLFTNFPQDLFVIPRHTDLKDILKRNDEVVTCDIDDPVYQRDVIACVVSAAMEKNLKVIIHKEISLAEFDAAASVVEGLGILSSIWNCEQGEKYIRARINKSFKQLSKMNGVPGTIRSAVLRQSICNIVTKLSDIKYGIIWSVSMCNDDMNGCVIPPSKDLARWIQIGLFSVYVDQQSSQIKFHDIGKQKLLKYLEMYNFRHSQTQDKMGIMIGGLRLIILLQRPKTMSPDVVDVWQSIWHGFEHLIHLKEQLVTLKVLMHVKYYLCISDGDYKEWSKAWSNLVHDDHTQLKDFIQDVLKADQVTNNYANTGKNACVLQGIRKMYRIGEGVEDCLGVEQVIKWLENVNNQNSDVVAREILFIIDEFDTIARRFEFVLSVYQYYVLKCVKSNEILKRVFVQYLPLQH